MTLEASSFQDVVHLFAFSFDLNDGCSQLLVYNRVDFRVHRYTRVCSSTIDGGFLMLSHRFRHCNIVRFRD